MGFGLGLERLLEVWAGLKRKQFARHPKKQPMSQDSDLYWTLHAMPLT